MLHLSSKTASAKESSTAQPEALNTEAQTETESKTLQKVSSLGHCQNQNSQSPNTQGTLSANPRSLYFDPQCLGT